MKKLIFLILAMSLPLCAQTQTTYQLGTNYSGSTFICSAASRYPVSSPYQFNCNGAPLLENGVTVGSVQIENAGGWIQVHAPGITDPQQYLESKLAPDMSQFSLPNVAGPGKVAFAFQITDANGKVFHGNVMAPWNDLGPNWRGWYYPQLLTGGTLTITGGPLQ